MFSVLWGAVLREECSLAAYWCLDHIVHNVGWNIDLVCDNNDPTSHLWYELIQVQSLSILKALESHKFEGLVMFLMKQQFLQLEPRIVVLAPSPSLIKCRRQIYIRYSSGIQQRSES